MGKSTLAEDFIEKHPEFVLEPEPYYVLQEQFGIHFAEEPTQESFITQLEYSLERNKFYEKKDNVIFDRCPLDYIAYLMCVAKRDFGNASLEHLGDLMRQIAMSIGRLELIVFLPIVDRHKIRPGADDDERFRFEVDHYFKQIYREDIYGLSSDQQPQVVELWGDRQSRLARLEAQIELI